MTNGAVLMNGDGKKNNNTDQLPYQLGKVRNRTITDAKPC